MDQAWVKPYGDGLRPFLGLGYVDKVRFQTIWRRPTTFLALGCVDKVRLGQTIWSATLRRSKGLVEVKYVLGQTIWRHPGAFLCDHKSKKF